MGYIGQIVVYVPGGGRVVDVSPWLADRELGDEHSTHDRASLTVLGVAQIGDLAAEQDAVVGVDRQTPDTVTCLARRSLHHRPELVVVADGRARGVTDRHGRGTRERRKVDHMRRAVW